MLQNQLKNIIIIDINLISITTRDFKRTLTERTKNTFDTLFFKEIDEKNIKELFDIKKDDLLYIAVTQ